MSIDPSNGKPRGVVHLDEVRRRLEAAKEDAVAPIRASFMAEFGEMLDDYLDEVRAATGGDEEKVLEEMIATCSTLLALAAEEHSDDIEERVDFIDTVAEIATDLVEDDDETPDLFGDDDR